MKNIKYQWNYMPYEEKYRKYDLHSYKVDWSPPQVRDSTLLVELYWFICFYFLYDTDISFTVLWVNKTQKLDHIFGSNIYIPLTILHVKMAIKELKSKWIRTATTTT